MDNTDNWFHIAYVSDHNFMLQCGVSMLSLVENAQENVRIHIHLLTDASMTLTDRGMLMEIEKKYPQMRLSFHVCDDSLIDSLDYSHPVLSKMVLYRLFLPIVLQDVSTCLYIDSDTLVWEDILPVFETDMNKRYIEVVLGRLLIDT